jgi:vancomycin resistance protein YoaR
MSNLHQPKGFSKRFGDGEMARSMNGLKAILAGLIVVGLAAAVREPRKDQVMGSYVTSLTGRTSSQRRNTLVAARRVDGAVIQSGATFSFDRLVGPWTPDRGYDLATVSYDGEMVTDWGGGVCQTSSALYNAALLAGLEIAERSHHTWMPKYVPPGLDATVTQREIDLKLRNPYPWPVRIRKIVRGDYVGFEILGREQGPMARVETQVREQSQPVEVMKRVEGYRAGQRRVLIRGHAGVRTEAWRVYLRGPKAGKREIVSLDSYPALNRVIGAGS